MGLCTRAGQVWGGTERVGGRSWHASVVLLLFDIGTPT